MNSKLVIVFGLFFFLVAIISECPTAKIDGRSIQYSSTLSVKTISEDSGPPQQGEQKLYWCSFQSSNGYYCSETLGTAKTQTEAVYYSKEDADRAYGAVADQMRAYMNASQTVAIFCAIPNDLD